MAWIERGWIEEGWIELPPLGEAPPISLDIGEPGDPVKALPFRALGGSVVDLDVLYGILGANDAAHDWKPLFAIATRAGILHLFVTEQPRQAILDLVAEAHVTLMPDSIEDFVVEGNPAGTNLFGSVQFTTRPTSSVVIDNSDGQMTQMDERELLMGCPAGLWWDINHQVLLPELVGVLSGIQLEGTRAVVTWGHASRRSLAPNISD